MGQTSYIYEAGCAFAIDGETTLLTGDGAQRGGTIYEQIEARGIPELLFEHFEGRLEYHAPWHHGRVLSHLFRGKVDVDEANALLGRARRRRPAAARQRRDRHARWPAVEGQHPRLPPGPARGQQGRRRRRPRPRPRLRPRADDRRRRLGRGPRGRRRGRPLLRRRQRPRARPRPARLPPSRNVTVTEGTMGDGFYEAVVSTLMNAAEPGVGFAAGRGGRRTRRYSAPK